MDDSVITVIIDDAGTVADHCVLIAEKLDLPVCGLVYSDVVVDAVCVCVYVCLCVSMLSTCCQQNPEEYSLLKPGSTLWLISNETLSPQGVDETIMVIFKKKYFLTDDHLDKSEMKETQLCLLYHQCQKAIVSGEYLCSSKEGIR
jgi:hypothetical protein